MSHSIIPMVPPPAVRLKLMSRMLWNVHCDLDSASICDADTWFFVQNDAQEGRSYHLEHFATGKLLWMPADECIRLEYDSVNMKWREEV